MHKTKASYTTGNNKQHVCLTGAIYLFSFPLLFFTQSRLTSLLDICLASIPTEQQTNLFGPPNHLYDLAAGHPSVWHSGIVFEPN